MKPWCKVAILSLLLMPPAASPAAAQSKAATTFARLKSLTGEWEAAVEGKPTRVAYKVVSNGTALLESISGEGHEDEMVTVYHLDRENLAMTHYCAAGNQPRMRAIPADISEDKITLRLVDTSNLKSPGDSQIIGLVVRFEGADHFTQEWTSRENGKVQTTIFRWTRKK